MTRDILGEGMLQYGNQLNELNFNIFNLEQKRLLVVVFYLCVHNNPYEKISIGRRELLNFGLFPKSSADSITIDRFQSLIQDFTLNCSRLSFLSLTRNSKTISSRAVPLFSWVELTFDEEIRDLNFQFLLNAWAIPYLTDLYTQYTRFPVQDFLGLKSSYSQTLFMHLKQFRSTGIWRVSKEDFAKIMGLPPSYTKESVLDRRVLVPCIQELSSFFPGLKLEKTRINSSPKSKITGYCFSWKVQKEEWNARKYVPYPEDHPLKHLSSFPSFSEIEHYVSKDPEFPLEAKEVYQRLVDQVNKGKKINDWRKYVAKIKENELKKTGKFLSLEQRKKKAKEKLKEIEKQKETEKTK